MSGNNLPTQRSKQIDEFLSKMTAARGRLVFALDATASRQPTWDLACTLQADMFREAATIGGLEIKLIYYRGFNECRSSNWTSNARELADKMSRITCMAGETQIARVLAHIRKEHAQKPINAGVFVGDAVEEKPHTLYDAAAGLGVPLFMVQEGADPEVEKVLREMARLTKGAYCKFAPGAAHELAEWLRAFAAFAAGGLKALQDLNTDSARKLLTELK